MRKKLHHSRKGGNHGKKVDTRERFGFCELNLPLKCAIPSEPLNRITCPYLGSVRLATGTGYLTYQLRSRRKICKF